MSIDIEHDSHAGHGDHAAGHDEHEEHVTSDKQYVMIALFLAVLTGAEVMLTEIDIHGAMFMVPLFVLMIVKFWVVVSFFMHLRFDNKLFSWLFYSGLFLALGVYIAALATFQFFSPG